jgi:hypothetical protein
LASRKSTIDGGSVLYPEFKCRAWINFNGTGTPAIRASGNVSSITDNGAGDFTINFTSAMPDANYAVNCIGSLADGVAGNSDIVVIGPARNTTTPLTASSVRIQSATRSTVNTNFNDPNIACVSIFR